MRSAALGRHAAIVAGVSLLLLVGFGACGPDDAGVSQTEEGALVLGATEQTARAERGVLLAGRTLVLDGFRGPITLEGSDDDVARLVFTMTARGRTAEKAAEALEEITLEESGDGATYRYAVSAKDPNLSQVRIEGTVPRQAALRLRLGSGHVALSGIEGALDVRLEDGTIQVGGAASEVQAQTRNGAIDVGMARMAAGSAVRLQTANGAVTLTLPRTSRAAVEAQTSAGTITTTGLDFSDRRLDPEGAGARFRGRLGDGGTTINLRTENGAIALREGTVLRLEAAAPADTTAPPDSVLAPPDSIPMPLRPPPGLPDSTLPSLQR